MARCVLFVAVVLSATVANAQQPSTINWNALRSLEVGTPNPKLTDAARERWYKSQLQRAFGRNQKPVFVGLAKVTDISEKDGKWTIKAVRELTDDEQLKHRIGIIKRSTEPVSGGFSAAGLSAGGGSQGRSFDREPSIAWTVDSKPKYANGHAFEARGEVTGMTWDSDTITATIAPPKE